MLRMVMTIAILGLLLGMVMGCGQSDSAEGGDNTASKEVVAEVTPEPTTAVRSIAAYDIDGVSHEVSEWLGKQPMVVNFWGTWCGPCRREVPDLVRLYEEYRGRGVEIVSLAVNDTPEKVRKYASQANMSWVMLLGDRSHASFFGLAGSVPTTIFYDRDGNEVRRFVGATSYDAFKPAFEAIL